LLQDIQHGNLIGCVKGKKNYTVINLFAHNLDDPAFQPVVTTETVIPSAFIKNEGSNFTIEVTCTATLQPAAQTINAWYYGGTVTIKTVEGLKILAFSTSGGSNCGIFN
jgi:hypothetical protein